LTAVDADLRLEQPRTLAGRTPAWFAQSILVKHETTVLASRWKHFDAMPCGDSGAQRVPQILFRVGAPKAHLTGNRGHRPRRLRKQIDQMAPEGHDWPSLAKPNQRAK
jgi:hypothetical protein